MKKILITLAVVVSACAPTAPVVDDDPPDCPVVITCAKGTLGEQTRLDGNCYECVQTTVAQAPFAWTQVAPCSLPPEEE